MLESFSENVYALCKKVPCGKVTTYKAIAAALGCREYQAIGQALRCNPYAPNVPCHRVVKSDGSIGGFFGQKNGKEIERKIMLLRQEGVEVQEKKVDLRKYLYMFNL